MALHPTYQVRELSTSAVEIWALRALRGEVIIGSSTNYYSLLTTHDMLLTTYYLLWRYSPGDHPQHGQGSGPHLAARAPALQLHRSVARGASELTLTPTLT